MTLYDRCSKNKRNKIISRWFYIYAIVWLPISCAYASIFILTTGLDASRIASSVFSNIVFPFLLGFPVYFMMLRWLVRGTFKIQVIIHILGSLVFSFLWSVGLFRALQLFYGLATDDWSFRGFSGVALVWQYFQGVTIYYMIVAGTYAVWFYDQLQNLQQQSSIDDGRPLPNGQNILSRFFARSGDDILPLELSEMICINGANDYAEITTDRGNRLSKLRLHEFESKLDANKFIRIHRSHIVNVDKILSMEPAGNGRMTVHLVGGVSVTASRKGAQKLRERFI